MWHKKGRSKYGAIKTVINGITFSSRREAARYCALLLELKAGKITDLTLQPVFKYPCGVKYIADFQYMENGKIITEDVKGMITPVFALKKRMWKFHYPDMELRISK